MDLTPSRITIGLLTAGAGTIILLAGISLAILSLVTSAYQFGWVESVIYSTVGIFILVVCRGYFKAQRWSLPWMILFYFASTCLTVLQFINTNTTLTSSSFQLLLLVVSCALCIVVMLYLIGQYKTMLASVNKNNA